MVPVREKRVYAKEGNGLAGARQGVFVNIPGLLRTIRVAPATVTS
jgi:hypothetical protein